LEETAIEIEQWCELLITKHRETFEAFSCFSLVNTQLAKNRLFYHPRDRKYVPNKKEGGVGGRFLSVTVRLFLWGFLRQWMVAYFVLCG